MTASEFNLQTTLPEDARIYWLAGNFSIAKP
jgi:hypothetical protein